MDKKEEISISVIKRLPRYYRFLQSLKENGIWVDIAGETGTTYSVVMTDRATYCCKAVLTKGGE